jgi:uncharacterized protein
VHRLTKAQARRIAVRAQLLDAPRPTDLLTVVRRLTLLQIDPTAAIAPSADLVAWSSLAPRTQRADLIRALEHDRTPFEHNALVRPMSHLGGSAQAASQARPADVVREAQEKRGDLRHNPREKRRQPAWLSQRP